MSAYVALLLAIVAFAALLFLADRALRWRVALAFLLFPLSAAAQTPSAGAQVWAFVTTPLVLAILGLSGVVAALLGARKLKLWAFLVAHFKTPLELAALAHLRTAVLGVLHGFGQKQLAALAAAKANGTLQSSEKALLEAVLAKALPFVQATSAGKLLLTTVGTFDPAWQAQIESVALGVIGEAVDLLVVQASALTAVAK